MKKSVIIILIIIFVIMSVVGVFYYLFFSTKMTLRNYFDNWKKEADDISLVINKSIVHYNDIEVNVMKILKNENIEYNVFEVLTIKNSRIYFVYALRLYEGDDNSIFKRMRNIASVNEKGEDFIIHHSAEFNDAYTIKSFSDANNDYSEKSGYYYNDIIVLNDTLQILEYSLSSNSVEMFHRNEYEFPKLKYSYTRVDPETLSIKNCESEIEKKISFEQISQSNEYGQKLYAMKNSKINTGDSATKNFLSGIHVINNEIYVLCQVRNWYGTAFAIVFKYNFEDESFLYAGYARTSDYVSKCVRIVEK